MKRERSFWSAAQLQDVSAQRAPQSRQCTQMRDYAAVDLVYERASYLIAMYGSLAAS